ncbi:MAG: prolipoprotein diacylglyceryl transferase [Coriobacteriia bacterium]|nr:prolipoprotein diacylglyceryl transferase [Coriobacteriia bacterium]
MNPILARFTLGEAEYVLRAYGTFYTLAWVIAPLAGAWVASRRGLPFRRVLALFAVALASGIVGARAFDLFIAGRYYAEDPSRIWAADFAGFSLYGGLVVATITGIALARAWRLPVWRIADSAVPALAVGVVLMRTGCFLNGCCYGLPTDLAWAVSYPAGSPVWQAQFLQGTGGLMNSLTGVVDPVHPTQLYEMAGAVLLAAGALWLMRRKAADGVPFLAFAIGFTLVRLGNGFVRARQSVLTVPEWFYPAFYLALVAVMIALLVWRAREGGAGLARAHAGPPTSPLPEPTPAHETGGVR